MKVECLLIRADASPQIGSGHVMRCLALAQAWKRKGGWAVFALAQPAGPIQARLKSEGFEVMELSCAAGSSEDARALADAARDRQAVCVVVDGYHFDAFYQRRIKEAGLRLLVLDDHGHAEHYCADYVLNQNPGASTGLYPSREPNTRPLLGPRFVLLRQEFLQWRGRQRTFPRTARKILATLGGSDPENVSLKLIEALSRLKELETTLVVGSNNPHWEKLQSAIGRQARRFTLLRDVANMPALMAEADLAIAAGGGTVWELAFMGLPALLVTLADNQQSNVEQLEAMGIARSLGRAALLSTGEISGAVDALLNDAVAREEMSRRGRALIDGEGSFRVWLHLKESSVQLRPATGEDCRLVWEWANDPVVRKVSFTPEPIPWADHVQWFEEKLRTTGSYYWIACDRAGSPVGQVRFDGRDGRTVISINLGHEHRGRNLGPLVIWLSCRKLFRETSVHAVQAWIKPDNTASVNAFRKAGFEQIGASVVNHQSALVFQLSKDRVEP